MTQEEDYILLSQLAQAGYCLRRACLIMNEQLWEESRDTAEGRWEHKNVHDRRIERRGTEIKLYEFDVISHRLGIRGKSDCIEAVRTEEGCSVPFCCFPVTLRPVEFKHGRVRNEEEYNMQLCAQAMCLEEMYNTFIPEGDIFYVSSHKRQPVEFTKSLRQDTENMIHLLYEMQKNQDIPPAFFSPKCKKCSMQDICMPKLKKLASSYCEQIEKEAKKGLTI